MKYLLVTFLIFNFLTITMAQVDPQISKIKSVIADTRNKFAPDKRIALFNVELEKIGKKLYLKGETNMIDAKNYLIYNLDGEGIIYEDSIEVLPSKSLQDKIYGVITLSVANIRTNPEHSAELSTQALLGTPIKILKKGKNGFYLIQTPDKYISWLDGDGFQMMNEYEWTDWKNDEKIIFTKEYGWAYENSDKNSMHISDLVAGNLLRFLDENSDFYKVEFPDKRIGYVNKSESEKFNIWYESRNPSAEDILQTAYRFMGVPYLWGGTSSKGMDCSGFTKTVYFLNGIILQRDASQQVNYGQHINIVDSWESFQSGDLLFFGSKANGNKKEKITHVAIYIGDGDFIHAAGRVRINSFNKSKSYYSEYREKSFIRAKRILNSIGENGIEKILDNDFYK